MHSNFFYHLLPLHSGHTTFLNVILLIHNVKYQSLIQCMASNRYSMNFNEFKTIKRLNASSVLKAWMMNEYKICNIQERQTWGKGAGLNEKFLVVDGASQE